METGRAARTHREGSRSGVGSADMCAMRLGVAVWLTDTGVAITELARLVEDAGLESLFLTEHSHVPARRQDLVQGDRPGEDARLLDQFTALGAAAACTSRLRLGTGICIVPQHDPIALAKRVATIDHISGGRFLFGVGAGWLVEELRNHGVDPPRRWALMEEQLLAMKAIWTADEAEFHGRLVDFDPIWSWPKPVQKPHPPVLVGGSGPHVLDRVLAYGDGWAPTIRRVEGLAGRLEELERRASEAGRDPIPVTGFGVQHTSEAIAHVAELGVARAVFWVGPGTRDEVAAEIEQVTRAAEGARLV